MGVFGCPGSCSSSFPSQAHILAQVDLGLQVPGVGPTLLGSETTYEGQEVEPRSLTP